MSRAGTTRTRPLHGRPAAILIALTLLSGVAVSREAGSAARIMTIPPNVRYVERFQRAQRQARDAGRGIWVPGDTGLRESPSEYRGRRR